MKFFNTKKTFIVAATVLAIGSGIAATTVSADYNPFSGKSNIAQQMEKFRKHENKHHKNANLNVAITPEQAVQTAQAQVGNGFTAYDVDLENKRGNAYYDVELVKGVEKVEVKVDAQTGAIIQEQAPSISSDQAVQIAQALPEAQGYSLSKVELDHKYGQPVYEVELRQGFNELDVKINAADGSVIRVKHDR